MCPDTQRKIICRFWGNLTDMQFNIIFAALVALALWGTILAPYNKKAAPPTTRRAARPYAGRSNRGPKTRHRVPRSGQTTKSHYKRSRRNV